MALRWSDTPQCTKLKKYQFLKSLTKLTWKNYKTFVLFLCYQSLLETFEETKSVRVKASKSFPNLGTLLAITTKDAGSLGSIWLTKILEGSVMDPPSGCEYKVDKKKPLNKYMNYTLQHQSVYCQKY